MPKKILLADDSLTIQKVVELTFSDSEYDLVCVGNGLRALEKVREARPDLILADVVMPEKNGYEVCEAIKGDPQTSRIPVILLTGTFEPFDRQRADRIGADAIVSKPFDSQQLLRQVEALLSNTTLQPDISGAATMALPLPIPQEIAIGGASAPPGRGEEAEPFDAGFAPDDFTGSIRIPTGDPFEEEFDRADPDSAAAAFEKGESGRGTAPAPGVPAAPPAPSSPFEVEDEIGGPSWLDDEPDRPAAPAPGERPHWMSSPMPPAPPLFEPAAADRRADDAPTAEIDARAFDLSLKDPVQEITADAAEELFDVPAPTREPEPASIATPPVEPESVKAASAPEPAASHPHEPHELEALAQTSTIPELAQMLTSVSRPADLSDADIDRLAARIVEKLSDRVIREIAWEVIPDMAEIVIKQRIKELEAGLE
ncbi:MAG TPA: response regulator [Thermoanaerobaculia bacterium]|jgi:CheY-like chemotaxis protein